MKIRSTLITLMITAAALMRSAYSATLMPPEYGFPPTPVHLGETAYFSYQWTIDLVPTESIQYQYTTLNLAWGDGSYNSIVNDARLGPGYVIAATHVYSAYTAEPLTFSVDTEVTIFNSLTLQGTRLPFRSYFTTPIPFYKEGLTVVPLPSAMLLFGTGILGFIGFRRR